MNAAQMLHQMCHDELSSTDVNAIRESRSFSKRETASRALLENFFLFDTGVEAAIRSLEKEEIVLLHLLKFTGEETAIPLFSRIYRDAVRPNCGTYTQRYKPIFKEVRRSLIRKGVLLFAEDRNLFDADTKNERRRFRFPQQFERFLPPLVKRTTKLDGDGDARTDVLRQKLLELVPGRQPTGAPDGVNGQYELKLVDGDLRIGGQAFRAERLLEWQRDCWNEAAPTPKSLARERNVWRRERGVTTPPIETAAYVFSQLGENEWVRPGQLSLALRIFCDGLASSEKICAAGWRWGYLARQKAEGVTYFRLSKASRPDAAPEDYMRPAAEGPLLVDLATVPYRDLERLARMASLQTADAKDPCLIASPNLVKMGRALETIRDWPLTQWLRENAPTFHQALETVEERWGKQIVHQNLLVAQVDDVGLKVQLEKVFPDPKTVLFLPNDYIAFPRRMFTKIKKAVDKAGRVIKLVKNDD
ncbi:MAG: hypothetical protein U9R15_08585 [Chloroflexota bacterium]|nr:hypothetical protein [Chloroflexota bacterium]